MIIVYITTNMLKLKICKNNLRTNKIKNWLIKHSSSINRYFVCIQFAGSS